MQQKRKYVLEFGIHVLSKYLLCDFVNLISLDVHLLQTKLCCSRAQHFTDITLHINK